jgi:hypothetical protein
MGQPFCRYQSSSDNVAVFSQPHALSERQLVGPHRIHSDLSRFSSAPPSGWREPRRSRQGSLSCWSVRVPGGRTHEVVRFRGQQPRSTYATGDARRRIPSNKCVNATRAFVCCLQQQRRLPAVPEMRNTANAFQPGRCLQIPDNPSDLEVQFAGQTARYKQVPFQETTQGNEIHITGTIPSTLTDFKIDPPSLLTIPIKRMRQSERFLDHANYEQTTYTWDSCGVSKCRDYCGEAGCGAGFDIGQCGWLSNCGRPQCVSEGVARKYSCRSKGHLAVSSETSPCGALVSYDCNCRCYRCPGGNRCAQRAAFPHHKCL